VTRRFHVILIATLFVAVPACRQRMSDQPSYRPLQASAFFPDGRASRPLLPGTVARGQLREDSKLYEGRDDKEEFVTEFPFEMTAEVLERGEQRFNIFCSVCHGKTGDGDGRIVQRGYTKPTNFNGELSRYYKLRGKDISIREVPVGLIYDVISHGYGAMPDYASQISVKDRWAIAGYVRALQYSQAPEAERKKMTAAWEKKQ
jgi:mono/diheme cytochrome c family protein